MEKMVVVNGETPANAYFMNKLQDNVENAIAEQVNTQTTTSDSETYSCNYINSILESGSNANGSYIKYLDGTMICYILKEYPNIDITNAWGSMYESDYIALGDFPQSFISTPVVTANCVGGSSVFIEALTPTTTSLGSTWFARPVSQANTTPKINFIAIGKWK